MISSLYILAGLIILSVAGCCVAYLYGKGSPGFGLDKYVAILMVPSLSCLGMSYFYGVDVIYFYVVAAVAGFIIEYVVGFTYKMVFGERMWTYHIYSVNGYTSYLSPPAWGVVGVTFFLLSKVIGL